MNEYKINTKSEIKRLEKERNNIVKRIIITSVIAVILIGIIAVVEATYSVKIILEKQQKINELQNKVEQQYYVIDALHQVK